MSDKALIEHEPGGEIALTTNGQAVQVFNPLDADTVQFRQQLQTRNENYLALSMHLRGMLVAGHDFGQIHVASKTKCPKPWACSPAIEPYHWSKHQLFAAGADKVLGMLGLGVKYPGESDVMRAALAGRPIEEVILKCQVVDQLDQVLAEELGACARSEVSGSLNNAVKRAAKRARVGAVMRLPSISALFEADFLAEVAKSAEDNTTSARARQPSQNHNTGAKLTAMPFGKHKGVIFQKLPDEYLEWVTMNMRDKPDIYAAACEEMERRTDAYVPPESPPAASQEPREPLQGYEEDDPGIPFDDPLPDF